MVTTLVPARQSDGRSKIRMPKRLAAELSHPDGPVRKEMTFTENVSPRGVRVTTVKRWQPGICVLVSFPRDGIVIQGRVIYCQRIQNGDFAVRLELSR